MSITLLSRKRVGALFGAAALMTALLMGINAPSQASLITVVSSHFRASNGETFTATNHLTEAAFSTGPHEYLLVWAGAADPTQEDFMAVIDATKGSAMYGHVINTVTLGPQLHNEPHHMEYEWHYGDRIYATGILSDTIFVFDTSKLPELSLVGVNLPQDTPCGSAPDAAQVLSDGTAYISYMGGPHVAGPCKYSNGETLTGNGEDGSPGEVVHISQDGKTLGEFPAGQPVSEGANNCHDRPALPLPTCANPHGIAIRQDLDTMVTADYTEIKDNLTPGLALDPLWLRNTVRTWNISNPNDPKLESVSYLQSGPRPATQGPAFVENRMVMEVAVTHLPGHKGAFASTMAGGAIYYTPDITSKHPVWREVFDDSAAYQKFDKNGPLSGINDGGSWLQVSPDDRFLFHAVMGANWELPRKDQSGMVFVLNIRKLLSSGESPKCQITTLAEVYSGGTAKDCPKVVSVLPIKDLSSDAIGVGPHWGAFDNFTRSRYGGYHETTQIRRIATSNYFLSEVGLDGDHRVCMINVSRNGHLSLDTSFRDEYTHQVCVDFSRTNWPQGNIGMAHPHGVLFVYSNHPFG